MYVVYDIFLAYDIVVGEDSNEVFFSEVAIDIIGNISTFRRNHELFSFVSLFFD